MIKPTQFNLESHNVALKFQNRAQSGTIPTSSIDWPIKPIRSRRKIEITAMRVNTWHACCAIQCGSRFIWKSCDCNYSPTITMPFEVFIFSTFVGNVLSGILYFNICAPRIFCTPEIVQ